MSDNPQWMQQKERANAMGIGILVWLLRYVGMPVVRFFLFFVVGYYFLTAGKRRNYSLSYLQRLSRQYPDVAPRPGWWASFRHFFAFSLSTVDKFSLLHDSISAFSFTGDNLTEMEDGFARQRGILVVGAHVGNFEVLRSLAGERKVKVNAVMHVDNAKKFNAAMRRINPDVALNIIELRDDDISQVITLQRCIENGEVVALLADRFYKTTRMRTVSCTFLGEEAPFPASPWILAGLLQCPVYMAAGVRTGRRRYHLYLQKVFDQIKIDRKNREGDIRKVVCRYAAFLENVCREHPYQWFNYFDFWSVDEKR